MKKLFGLFMMLLIMALFCGVAVAHNGCHEHGTQPMVLAMDLDDGPVGLIKMPLITAMNEKGSPPVLFKDNKIGTQGLPHSTYSLVAAADIKYLPDVLV